MDNSMNDLWRVQQDAAAQLTESWRTLLQPAAAGAARPTAEADEKTPQLVEPEPEPEPEPSAPDAYAVIQVLLDGQRDLAEHLTRWAALQRDLADTSAAWASRQRDHAAALDRLLAPLSPGAVDRPV